MKHHSTAANLRPHTNLQPHTHRNPLLTRRSAMSLIVASSTIAIASLSACGLRNSATNSDSTSNQNSSAPLVLTTFTVIQDMASRVAGEFCQVESITKAGAEIHDYEPTPDDLKRAQKAQLILNNGLGLERWFERFVDESPAQRADLSEGITAIPIAEGDFQGQANPHAWMSPEHGKIYVENIVRALSSLVPDHAKDFEANGDAYKKELDNISSRLIEELSALPENQRTLVTCEGAFSYLCRDTNMKELYLWAVNAADEGTPQQIAKVVEAVKSQQIPAVFCESTVNPKAMQQVADETGATLKTTVPFPPILICFNTMQTQSYLDSWEGNCSMNLCVSQLCAWYEKKDREKPIIHDVNFSLSTGDLCALVGVNGAGKSTLFKALMDTIPCEGSITWGNQTLSQARKLGKVSYVPQTEAIDATFPLLVKDVVMQGRYVHQGWMRIASTQDKELVAQALERVNLIDLMNCPLAQLSGGQRKRVFVARGIAQAAELVFLDEPFAGVDARSEAIITEQLNNLRKEGKTLLVSIHDINLAQQKFPLCLVINRTITAQGPSKEILSGDALLQNLGISEDTHIEEVLHA